MISTDKNHKYETTFIYFIPKSNDDFVRINNIMQGGCYILNNLHYMVFNLYLFANYYRSFCEISSTFDSDTFRAMFVQINCHLIKILPFIFF